MRLIPLIFLLLCCVSAQFRYSAGAGLAVTFPAPDMDEFNSTLDDSGLSKVSPYWIPTSFAVSVEAYPSVRLGYVRYSNGLLKNRSSQDWALTVSMSGISVESFLVFLKRFEGTFGFELMLARADFSQTEISAESSPFQLPTRTSVGIQHRSTAFASWLGLKFYLNSFLALEATMGYLNLAFKGTGWKSGGQETDVRGMIDMSRPVFGFGIVGGW